MIATFRVSWRLPAVPLLPFLFAACAGTTSTSSPAPRHAHFALAHDLATFAVDGDLARLRIIAADMADSPDPPGLPGGSGSQVDAIRSAAHRAATDSTLTEATSAVTTLAASCGACHRDHTVAAGPGLRAATLRIRGPATRHEDYLGWVSDLLWSALVAPSNDAWETATGALAGADGVPAPHATFVPADEVARDRAVIRRAAIQAVTAKGLQERARYVARIWGTCTDCHVKASVAR